MDWPFIIFECLCLIVIAWTILSKHDDKAPTKGKVMNQQKGFGIGHVKPTKPWPRK